MAQYYQFLPLLVQLDKENKSRRVSKAPLVLDDKVLFQV